MLDCAVRQINVGKKEKLPFRRHRFGRTPNTRTQSERGTQRTQEKCEEETNKQINCKKQNKNENKIGCDNQ